MSKEEIQIPKGWNKTLLHDITNSIGDGIHSTPNYVDNSDFYFINGNNLRDGSIVITQNTKKVDKDEYKKYKLNLGKNTVLLSINGTIGNLSFYKNEQVILGKSACYINCNDDLDPKFLFYLLQSNQIKNYFRGELNQTSIPNLSLKAVRMTPIMLPPLSIQKKIVQKIIPILEQLEEKKKQILQYKKKKEQTLSQLSQKTIGGIITNHMKLDNPPKDWQVKTLEDCIDIQAGFAQGQKNIKDGTIHLRMNNIGRNFQINYDLVRTINPTKDQLKKYRLEKDDVVFNNTNSPELVGKSFIFDDDKLCLYSNHLTRCRVKKDLILPEWLLFYIRGRWLRRDFERMCNKWINQAAIGGTKLKNLEIPIPSISEQKQILKILTNASTQFEEISNLTEMIKIKDLENEKYIDHIQSSILDSAFSGKLVN